MTRLRVCLVALLYLTLGTYAIPTLRIGSLPYAVVLSGIIAAVAGMEQSLQPRSAVIPMRLLWAGALFVMSLALTFVTAIDVDTGRFVKTALLVGSTLLMLVAAREPNTVRLGFVCLGVSSGLVFAYGVYGYVTGNVGDPIEHTFGYFGVTYMTSTRNSDVVYFQTAFWVALSVAMFGRGWRRVAAGAALVVAGGIVLSLARGAWISTGLALAVVSWRAAMLRSRAEIFRASATIVGVLSLVVAASYVGSIAFRTSDDFLAQFSEDVDRVSARFRTLGTFEQTDGNNSNDERLQLVVRSAELTLTHPLGVGVGNARHYLADKGDSGLNHVENEYLQLLVEQSILGLMAYLGLIGYVITRALRYTSETSADLENRWIGWAVTGMFVDWAVYGLFNVLHDSTWFWLVLGLAIAWARTSKNQSARTSSPKRLFVPANATG